MQPAMLGRVINWMSKTRRKLEFPVTGFVAYLNALPCSPASVLPCCQAAKLPSCRRHVTSIVM